jgi:hypothetical protein
VRVSELLAESATDHDERVHPVGYAVQRALMSYAGADDVPDLANLRGRVDTAWSIWQGSPHRYTEASEVLPGLIIGVQAAQRGLARGSSADERREVQRVSADLFFLLRTFTKRIGRTDLSLLVADRPTSLVRVIRGQASSGNQIREAQQEPSQQLLVKPGLGRDGGMGLMAVSGEGVSQVTRSYRAAGVVAAPDGALPIARDR